MRVIYGRRKSGRTTTLIELAAESGKRGETCYIVCHNHDEAYRIKQKADEKGLYIGFPLTYDEFIKMNLPGSLIHHLYIDNVEKLLQYMSFVKIEAITILKEEEEPVI